MGKSVTYLIIGFISFAAVLAIFTFKTDAANLTQALLRLDRLAASTQTGGMVCAEPSTAATEGQVAVTFPSGFTVNTTDSNWTVSTSNILSGASAWPGIGTATSVLSQTVTFPSSDLAVGTMYCFNFASANTLTTGSVGDKTGVIATLTGGGTTIDTRTYGVTVNNNDQLTVTATVAANPTDFEAETVLVTPSGDTFPQDTTLTYQITYGSNLAYPSNITVEAEWSLGTISGSGTPTIALLDYVIGSASDAYGSTPPVIDTVNRTITWEITGFPASTLGETVTFQLITNDNYTGPSLVSFDVSGRVVGPGTQTPDSTVTKNYQYNFGQSATASPGPGATSTPGPTSTSAPGTTSTPTPTGIPAPTFIFEGIDMEAIGVNSAKVGITTSNPATLTISYGTSIDSMVNIINSIGTSPYHSIQLSGLTRATRYYFRVAATDNAGRTITSDIFTFQTALSDTDIPKVDFRKLIILANNKILFLPFSDFEILDIDGEPLMGTPFVVLPTTFPFEFRLGLEANESIERIFSYIKNESVLGINNLTEIIPPETDIELFELSPGIYSGRLLTKQTPGIFSLNVRIYDTFGNISEHKLATIKIVPPFTVAALDGKPIENAKVVLYVFDPKTKLFKYIPPDTYPIKNPEFADVDGTISYALPKGRYFAEVSAIGFKDKEVEFIIGEYPEEKYPKVTLEKAPFNLFTIISYYITTLVDVYHALVDFIARLSTSLRFFDLIAALALLLLVATSLFAFSIRTHIPLFSLPLYFIFHFGEILRIKHGDHFAGEIMDSNTGRGIPAATVSFYDQSTGRLIATVTTDALGEFILKNPTDAKSYKVVIQHSNYHGITINDYRREAAFIRLQFVLDKKGEELEPSMREVLTSGIENIIGFAFESVLLGCFIFELIFIQTIGIAKTLPFLIISLFTLLLWLFYARRVVRRHLSPSY